jgi:hypothetical protein
MARNMDAVVKSSFPNTPIVVGSFYVVKCVLDSVQHLNVMLSCKAIDQDNEVIKETGIRFKSIA